MWRLREVAKIVKNSTKVRPARKQQTVRERTQSTTIPKRQRVKNTAGKITSKVRLPKLKLPNNKFFRILGKLKVLYPKFLLEAWREIRQVTWPTARETYQLTMAVFIFAVIFAAIVGAIDYGLDKLFREVIIKK
jgi:preprotein translocase SecE subunit